MEGIFEPFYMSYKKLSDPEQAIEILTEATKFINRGAKGVAITYSANYGQSLLIKATYEAGNWFTGTSGSNQANVMHHMEQQLSKSFASIQSSIRIAPITTMSYSSPPFGGGTHLQAIHKDLDNIETLLAAGWAVLGWQNENSLPGYAIGSGIALSMGSYTASLDGVVQRMFKQYTKDYPYIFPDSD